MALITYAQYTALYAVPSVFTQAMVEEVIDRVSDALNDALGRNYEAATYTDVMDGDGSETLLVRNPPIRTLTSIAVTSGTSTTTYTSSSSPALSDLFRWTGSTSGRGEIRYADAVRGRFGVDDFGLQVSPQFGVYPCFPEGFQNITVVYDGGYTTIPDRVLRLVSILVSHELKRIGTDRSGRDLRLVAEGLGNYSYTLSPAQEADEILRELLHTHRRIAL